MAQTVRSLAAFIREHRQEIDEHIRAVVPDQRYFNDEERRLWVLNDEGLYLYARESGVREI